MRSIKPHVTPDEYAELRDSGRRATDTPLGQQ